MQRRNAVSCLNRMGLIRRMLISVLGVGLFVFHLAGAQAKVNDCYMSNSYLNKYGAGKTLNMGDVTGMFDSITGAPASDVLLGMKTIDLFDNDDDLECSDSSGDNSVTVFGMSNVPASGIAGTDSSGRTLYLVNQDMPGIAYSMEIICQGGDESGECQGHSGDTIPIVAGSTATWINQDGHPWDDMKAIGSRKSGMNFKLNVYFWQLPSWQPFPFDGDYAGSRYGLFSMRFGSSAKHGISYYFDVHLVPKTPTCDTHISVDGNPSAVINLGDGITPQQLSGDSTDKVPFTLVVDNCSATLNNVYVKMTSTTVDSNNATLLGQQSGSAAGVGVKITDTQDNPLSPDGASVLTFPYTGTVNHREMPMQAQLVSDGTPVQPGDFQASATFNISYD